MRGRPNLNRVCTTKISQSKRRIFEAYLICLADFERKPSIIIIGTVKRTVLTQFMSRLIPKQQCSKRSSKTQNAKLQKRKACIRKAETNGQKSLKRFNTRSLLKVTTKKFSLKQKGRPKLNKKRHPKANTRIRKTQLIAAPELFSSSPAIASQLLLLPRRSQLQTSATSRGRSATFWADLHVTYFNKICQNSVEPIINQIRQQAHQQGQTLLFEQSGRFGDHFSFYDYYKDAVVQGMQDLIDYEGKWPLPRLIGTLRPAGGAAAPASASR